MSGGMARGALPARESTGERLLELLCCWLLAVGAALMMNVQFPYPAGWPAVLWQTLLPILLLGALSWRRRVLPVTAAAVAAGGLLLLLATRQLRPAVGRAVEFMLWWFDDLPQDSPLFTPQNMTVVHGLVHVWISAGAFFAVRYTRRAWPAAVLCGAVLAPVILFGDRSYNAVAVAAYLAGLFPLIARDHYSGRRLFSRRERFSPMGRRGVLPAVSAGVCLLALSVLLAALPADTGNIRTRLCSDITADVQSITGWFTADQKALDRITLYQLGLQPEKSRLGGDRPALPPEQVAVVAVTDASQPLLLRVTTYDTFTGTKWKNTFAPAYRADGYAQKRRRQELSGAAESDAALPPLFVRQPVTVTLTAEARFLMTAGQTAGFTENTATKNPVLFNRNGELFSFFTMPAGYAYTLDAVRLDLPLRQNAEHCAAVQGVIGGAPAEEYDPRALEQCLQLPDALSPEAEKTALALQKQYPDSFRLAAEICRYFSLSGRFTYTDQPGKLGKNDNVVHALMTTGKGYSVYFASAMAAMTRTVGIPTRLAAGYRTVKEKSSGLYVASNFLPYAWVECYFPRLGWVAFDPAPTKGEQHSSAPQLPTVLPEPIVLEEPDEPPEDDPPEEDVKEERRPFRLPAAAVWGGVLLLAAGLLALRSVAAGGFYDPAKVARRFPGAARQGEYYYQDLLRQMALLGCRPAAHETLTELAARFCRRYPEAEAALAGAVAAAGALHYGGGAFTAAQAADISAAREAAERLLRRRLWPPVYWLLRRALLPYFTVKVYRHPAEKPPKGGD